jgi:hypothetical protein
MNIVMNMTIVRQRLIIHVPANTHL